MVFEYHGEEETEIDPNSSGGKYGYRIGHTDGKYTIPDRVLNTVDDRNVKVLTVCLDSPPSRLRCLTFT